MSVTTEEILLQRYGSPLLTIQQVAEILNRSPDGLRLTLAGNNEVAEKLRPAKRRIGRRVLFSVTHLSRFIDESVA
jgi:hypothetical protein